MVDAQNPKKGQVNAAPSVFVSYAGEEAALAQGISQALRAVGIDAFFAGWEIDYGDDFVKRLNDGLSRASFFVLLVSENFLRKAWPTAEQSAATVRMVEDNARIIPVNLGVPRERFPPLIRRLRRVSGESGDAQAIAAEIAPIVFGVSSKPPLGPLPAFLDHSLLLRPFPSLTTADKAVLRVAFEIGAENFFRAEFEKLGDRAGQAGINTAAMLDSLEILERAYLIKVGRHLSGIYDVELTVQGAEVCCSELVPDYTSRKREILAAIVNLPNPHSASSDEVVDSTHEPRWLVCHVLRDAERQGDLKIHPVFIGHEYYAIDHVSTTLKRKMQEHSASGSS